MQSCLSCWRLSFSCSFWSGDPVVNEETWIIPRKLYFVFEIVQSLITFLISENLTECVQVQLTWKLSCIAIFRYVKRCAILPTSNTCGAIVQKKEKKEREREKTVHSTNDDCSRQIFAGNSGKSWRQWRAFAAHRTPLPLMVKHAYGRCPTRTQLSTRPLVTGHIWRRNTPQSPQKMGEGDYGRIPKDFCPPFDFGEEGKPSNDFSYFFHIFFTINFWSATVQSFA